jgi:GT2 family glycosyltransferase
MKPTASLITLTYNQPEYIRKLKESIEKTNDISQLEWVVVDNGSDAETPKIFRDVKWVKYIKHDNSGNFSSMNNMAVLEASSDVLIFLNNDMEATTDFVERMRAVLLAHEQIGCVGAVLVYPDNRLQHAGVIFTENAAPANLGSNAVVKLNLNHLKASPDNWKHPTVFEAVTGACLAIRKSDFLMVGGFHVEFNWAYEDVDLCLRVKFLLGKISVVDPFSRLIHHESVSGGERQIQKNLNLFVGRYMHCLKADYKRFY